jgi:serine/threonine protein kinase
MNIKRGVMKDYKFEEEIGSGEFGNVFKAIHIKSGRVVAIKRILIEKIRKKKSFSSEIDLDENFVQEISILKLCKHPHIVEYIDLYMDTTYVYIVMEYLKGTELFDYLLAWGDDLIPIGTVRNIFTQIISAIEFCHGNLIAHRDIKLENIMIDEIEDSSGESKLVVKLIDFGLSKMIDLERVSMTRCGSPYYVAPEVLECDDKPYNPLQSDIWSLGIILYMITTGGIPWNRTDNIRKLFDEIIACDWRRDDDIPDDVNDTLEKMLTNVNDRMTLQELKKEDWLAPYCVASYLPSYEPQKEMILLLVDKIVSLGFDEGEVLLSIYKNTNNAINNIYHILLKKHNESRGADGRIKKDKSRATVSHQELYSNP